MLFKTVLSNNSNYCVCSWVTLISASQMKHIIMRFTCWLPVDGWGFWGWLCTVRGGGVGTGLGVGVGFWDWDEPHPFLLAQPRSFLKLSTACEGETDGQKKNAFLYSNQKQWRYIFSTHVSIHLSEKFIGDQGIRWNIWLATSGADVFLWIQ